VFQSASEMPKTMIPITIRITPTTCGSTLPPLELTAHVRIAPKATRNQTDHEFPSRPAFPATAIPNLA
jgi:hypothetical protein